jgi:hypothetical protein
MTPDDLFSDGMSIFLSYLARQSKKDADYLPHSLIRAFVCAFEALKELEDGQIGMGNSSEGEKDNIVSSYVVVLKKHKESFEVLEVKDVVINKPIPVDFMIALFNLQIVVDRIPGDRLLPEQIALCLNDCFDEPHFVALGDNWKAARTNFLMAWQSGKVKWPDDFDRSKIEAELKTISEETPWEHYSSNLRSMIGTFFAKELSPSKKGAVCITSPKDAQISKSQVFAIAKSTLLGRSGTFSFKRKYR